MAMRKRLVPHARVVDQVDQLTKRRRDALKLRAQRRDTSRNSLSEHVRAAGGICRPGSRIGGCC